MRIYIFILIMTLCGCHSKDNLSDISKHNTKWMWHIKTNEQEGQWVAIADTGTFSIDNGESIWWYDNGVKELEGTKVNGNRIRHWISWHPNGKIKSDVFYSNDTIYQRAWYENGNKKLEGALRDSIGTGQWFIWFDNGQLNKDILYRNDTAYQKQWYSNGRLHGIGIYYKNKSVGKLERWYDNGNPMDLTYWDNDIQIGPCVHYYENGKIKSEGTWDNGKSIGYWKFYNKNQKIDSIIKCPEMVWIK